MAANPDGAEQHAFTGRLIDGLSYELAENVPQDAGIGAHREIRLHRDFQRDEPHGSKTVEPAQHRCRLRGDVKHAGGKRGLAEFDTVGNDRSPLPLQEVLTPSPACHHNHGADGECEQRRRQGDSR